MRHDFWWFSIDWSNSRFVWTLILVAVIGGVIAFVIDRIFRRFTWSDNKAGYYIVALLLASVIFKAVAWDVAGWMHVIFWIIWWGALITSVLALIPFIRIVFTAIARILTGVVWGILLLLLVLIPVLWNSWAPDINTYADSDPTGLNPSVSTDLPSSEGSSSPTAASSNSPGSSPSGTTNGSVGASACEDISWDNVSTEMPAAATWSTRVLIAHANTGFEAFQAFQNWYDNTAMDNAALYYQLAEAVGVDPPEESSLVSNGQATSAFSCLTDQVEVALEHARYIPEHKGVLVQLHDANKTEFRLIRASGQVQ